MLGLLISFAATKFPRKALLTRIPRPEKNSYDNISPREIFQQNNLEADWTKSVRQLWFLEIFFKTLSIIP